MPILGPNIANLQTKRDVAGLVQACKSKDIRTRCAALHALGELRDPRAAGFGSVDALRSARSCARRKTMRDRDSSAVESSNDYGVLA